MNHMDEDELYEELISVIYALEDRADSDDEYEYEYAHELCSKAMSLIEQLRGNL